MKDINSSDRELIASLFEKRDWLDLFELHTDFHLSPAQVLDSVERLEGAGYIERESLQARLTDAGRDWVIASRRAVFMNLQQDWRSFEARERLVEENEPYMPDLTKLDHEFFKALAKSN